MTNLEEKVRGTNTLEVVHPNMAELSRTDKLAFALQRRCGFGASDASTILGINPWHDMDSLIKEKKSTIVTADEIAIGEKESVRKGSDLEPLNLQKFSERFNMEVCKPSAMFRIKEHPQLTINFDGVVAMGEQLIPVEAKFCSLYANKYYDRSRCINHLSELRSYIVGSGSLQDRIKAASDLYGIPPYYYTQLQHQMLGLNAPFGYLTVLFDKGWEHGVYSIGRDEYVQEQLIRLSKEYWDRIKGE